MVKIDSIHFDADEKLVSFIEKKFDKINSRYPEIVSIDVKLRLENSGQIRDKITEIILAIPKHTFIAKGEDKTFESSVNEAVGNIQRQLKKFKQKLIKSNRG